MQNVRHLTSPATARFITINQISTEKRCTSNATKPSFYYFYCTSHVILPCRSSFELCRNQSVTHCLHIHSHNNATCAKVFHCRGQNLTQFRLKTHNGSFKSCTQCEIRSITYLHISVKRNGSTVCCAMMLLRICL